MSPTNGIYSITGEPIKDIEWEEAESSNDKPQYYKMTMLNGGKCYKKYKPQIAELVVKKGMFLKAEKSN